MKICYLSDGNSIHTWRWANYFANRGHDVHLITTRAPIKEFCTSGVTVHFLQIRSENIAARALRYFLLTPKIKRIIKSIKPDVLHAQYITHYGTLGILSGFHPIILSPWGEISLDPERSKVLRAIIKFDLGRADLVQCMDKSFYDRVRELNKKCKARVLREGVSPSKFKNKKLKPAKTMRVLCLRKIKKSYDVPVLIDAIPYILEKHKNIKFIMLKTGDFYAEIRKKIERHELRKYIEFLDWTNKDIVDVYNNVDIYVDTFNRKTAGSGIGKTALEAMACELPVVIANNPGVDLFVKDGQNGLVYEGGDPKSLAKAITKLIGNKSLRWKLGKNARKFVVEEQNWDKNTRVMEKEYERLVAEHNFI